MRSLIVMLAALVLISPAFANKDKEVPVYQTGTILYDLPHYDSSSSVRINGQTYFTGCNESGTSVSCSDSTGVTYLKLADGTKMFRPDQMYDFGVGMFVASPVPTGRDEAFKYRIVHVKPRYSERTFGFKEGDYVCVPYTNYKGKPAEACSELKVETPEPDHMIYTQADVDQGVKMYGYTPKQAEDWLITHGFHKASQ